MYNIMWYYVLIKQEEYISSLILLRNMRAQVWCPSLSYKGKWKGHNICFFRQKCTVGKPYVNVLCNHNYNEDQSYTTVVYSLLPIPTLTTIHRFTSTVRLSTTSVGSVLGFLIGFVLLLQMDQVVSNVIQKYCYISSLILVLSEGTIAGIIIGFIFVLVLIIVIIIIVFILVCKGQHLLERSCYVNTLCIPMCVLLGEIWMLEHCSTNNINFVYCYC